MAGRRVKIVRAARFLGRRRRVTRLELDDVRVTLVEHHAHIPSMTAICKSLD